MARQPQQFTKKHQELVAGKLKAHKIHNFALQGNLKITSQLPLPTTSTRQSGNSGTINMWQQPPTQPVQQNVTTFSKQEQTLGEIVMHKINSKTLKEFFENKTMSKLHVLRVGSRNLPKQLSPKSDMLNIFSALIPKRVTIECALDYNIFVIINGYSVDMETLHFDPKKQLNAITVNIESPGHCTLASYYLGQLQEKYGEINLTLLTYEPSLKKTTEITDKISLRDKIEYLDEEAFCHNAPQSVKERYRSIVANCMLAAAPVNKQQVTPLAVADTKLALPVVQGKRKTKRTPAPLCLKLEETDTDEKPNDGWLTPKYDPNEEKPITEKEITEALRLTLEEINELDLTKLIRTGVARYMGNKEDKLAAYCTLRASVWDTKSEDDQKALRITARRNLNNYLNDKHKGLEALCLKQPSYPADENLDKWFEEDFSKIAALICSHHTDVLSFNEQLFEKYNSAIPSPTGCRITRRASSTPASPFSPPSRQSSHQKTFRLYSTNGRPDKRGAKRKAPQTEDEELTHATDEIPRLKKANTENKEDVDVIVINSSDSEDNSDLVRTNSTSAAATVLVGLFNTPQQQATPKQRFSASQTTTK